MSIVAERYHDISCGHRVAGHESKCAFLHGHNYRIHFTCAPTQGLDGIGRVIDFSVIKEKLCVWLEEHWDHQFLAWLEDPAMLAMQEMIAHLGGSNIERERAFRMFTTSLVWVTFNPTAENMATYLLDVMGPQQLVGTGVVLTQVRIDETRKCSAVAQLP